MSQKKKGAVSVLSAALVGIDAQIIEVECDQRPGLIQMSIVGLADKACVEAKERIRSALRNCGLKLPQCHVVFNLAPAELHKHGSGFDLAMAVALLVRREELPAASVRATVFIGELSLDGKVRAVSGVLSAVQAARAAGCRRVVVSVENGHEAALVAGMDVRVIAHLREVLTFAKGENDLPRAERRPDNTASQHVIDFSEIRGHAVAKRALEIAAAGNHHVLLSGPPGSGKSLLAQSLISLLPPLSNEEMIEVTKIHSAAGLLLSSQPVLSQRPWRAPHHSASVASLVGGGGSPKPGEISLAHRGVLFLDELPEFPRMLLDHLRQPLESGVMSVSRARQAVEFPARFLLIAARNPCPCGYAGDPDRMCICLPAMIKRYQQRLSGPLLDRFDLHVDVPRVDWQELSGSPTAESSSMVCERVTAARKTQQSRQGKLNQELSSRELGRVAQLPQHSLEFLQQAARRLHLSNRAYFRVLRVARTIADLAGATNIDHVHVAEALQFRLTEPS